MHIRTFLKPLSFLPAIFMMYIIFVFSSQEADLSSSVSQRASVVIVKTADYVFDLELEDWQTQDYALRINGVTRKLAHMTEYFLLAIAVSFPLYVYGLHGILLVLVAGIICVGYACTDEYHQAFVAGRAASAKDVGIDSFGVLIGIILVRIIGWTGRHTIFTPLPDEKGRRQSRRELKRIKKQQARMQRTLKEQQKRYENDRRSYEQEKNSYGPDYDRDRNNRYDPYYGDPYYDDPYYDDPDYDDPDYDDPDYDDAQRDLSSDDLSDDMPLSRFLNRRR